MFKFYSCRNSEVQSCCHIFILTRNVNVCSRTVEAVRADSSISSGERSVSGSILQNKGTGRAPEKRVTVGQCCVEH
jgi:hypothetical protein